MSSSHRCLGTPIDKVYCIIQSVLYSLYWSPSLDNVTLNADHAVFWLQFHATAPLTGRLLKERGAAHMLLQAKLEYRHTVVR